MSDKPKPSKSIRIMSGMKDIISFPRLEILKETDSSYLIKVGDKVFEIKKGKESFLDLTDISVVTGIGVRQELRKALSAYSPTKRNNKTTQNYQEADIFHDIREDEYKDAGFMDAHRRAMHDLILYVLKHFQPGTQTAYLRYATKMEFYRLVNESEQKTTKAEMRSAYKYGIPVGELEDYHTSILRLIKKAENIRQLYQSIPLELRNDRKFVLEMVKLRGVILRYVSEKLKNDREITIEAVKQDSYAIRWIADKFKNDREIALEAVNQDGTALRWMSKKLKNNREVVLTAVKKYRYALKYASPKLQNDPEVQKAAGL
jgi:hypothetical protein